MNTGRTDVNRACHWPAVVSFSSRECDTCNVNRLRYPKGGRTAVRTCRRDSSSDGCTALVWLSTIAHDIVPVPLRT